MSKKVSKILPIRRGLHDQSALLSETSLENVLPFPEAPRCKDFPEIFQHLPNSSTVGLSSQCFSDLNSNVSLTSLHNKFTEPTSEGASYVAINNPSIEDICVSRLLTHSSHHVSSIETDTSTLSYLYSSMGPEEHSEESLMSFQEGIFKEKTEN